MPHARTEQALVLRAYDVGEADRFCVLFTEHLGKVSARARAVRKMKSRFGGSILPLQRVNVQLVESSAGYLATGAECVDTHDGCRMHLHAYRDSLEACDLLLRSLPDDEASPEIFSLACGFFSSVSRRYDRLSLIVFKLRLLDEFGGFPSMQQSVISGRTIVSDAPLYFSHKHSGFCLSQEDFSIMTLSDEASHVLRHLLEFSFDALPMLKESTLNELSALLTQLSFHQFTTMSAPSKFAPVPVGSPATPTW